MINIVVSHDKRVTGDVGKIAAYENQDYSEVIQITHPLFEGAKYFIEYKYLNTIYRNELDANGQVSIKIEKAGYAKCQLIAVDIVTKNIIFASDMWNLIVKEVSKIQPSHYPCDSHFHYTHRAPVQIIPGGCGMNDFNAYEAYSKLAHKLSNEEDIRFNEIQKLNQEIVALKEQINELLNASPDSNE